MLMFFFLANDMSSLNAQQPDQAHMGEHVFRWLSMGIFINQLFIFCKSIYPRIEGTICRIHRQYLRLKTIISCKISLQANHFWVETCWNPAASRVFLSALLGIINPTMKIQSYPTQKNHQTVFDIDNIQLYRLYNSWYGYIYIYTVWYR